LQNINDVNELSKPPSLFVFLKLISNLLALLGLDQKNNHVKQSLHKIADVQSPANNNKRRTLEPVFKPTVV
jgi:uncharacterized secreted protein with C-terminal beta-propeller domain